MTDSDFSREWARIASVPTATRVFAAHVDDLAPVVTDQLRRYIQQLPLPAGWLPTRIDNTTELAQPLRVAVYPTPEGGWDGCDTLTVFRFTGTPPSPDLACQMTEQALVGLGAENITNFSHGRPPTGAQITETRSSGELDLAGQRVWLQYAVYSVGAQQPGILIEHTTLVAAYRRDDLADDIKTLSNRCYGAVRSIRDAVRHPDAQAAAEAAAPTLRIQPYDDMGIPSILVNANRNGMRLLQTAAQSARTDGEYSFSVDGVAHRIIQQADAAMMEITYGAVTWRFDQAKLSELLDMLEPFVLFWNPGHNYFDLDLETNAPVEQLVLAVDEYVGGAPPYGEFPELSTTPPPTQNEQIHP